MSCSTRSFMVLVSLGFALAACGKKDAEPQAIPVPSAASAPVPVASAPASAPVSAAPTPPPPPVAAAPVQQASIDACCAALAGIAKSGRGKETKTKAALAAKICPGIAKLVKEGKSQRSSALAQVKSGLVGVDIPSECH